MALTKEFLCVSRLKFYVALVFVRFARHIRGAVAIRIDIRYTGALTGIQQVGLQHVPALGAFGRDAADKTVLCSSRPDTKTVRALDLGTVGKGKLALVYPDFAVF